MAIDLDDELRQDFLVEATETLGQLGDDLVVLEQEPDNSDLLNQIFRGFHNIKGGSGFLGLTPLVNLTHRAEDVFNVLRQGERTVTPHLMDVVLHSLDIVNEMVNTIREGEEPDEAETELLDRLKKLAVPEAEAETETASNAQEAVESDDSSAAAAQPAEGQQPSTEEGGLPDPADAGTPDSPGGQASAIGSAEYDSLVSALGGSNPGSGDEISDDEFEALLDKMHGTGKLSAKSKSSAVHPEGNKDMAGEDSTASTEQAANKAKDDEIGDQEFDQLLDQLHGKGGIPGRSADAPLKKQAVKAPKPAAGRAAKAGAVKDDRKSPSSKQEVTVRVDTARLDDIMNMVGELVLARNRLSTLESSMQDEDLSKAIAHLNLVTSDLQSSVMKTRMQPIKKAFSRFPRVVRDLARNLKKEIKLEMSGEETDLDKNLVEALGDPLVHLVRNSVDHGLESPEQREKKGKSRVGTVLLSAAQEGDHILLKIKDDGNGIDADVLRRKAVEKKLMDASAADRLTEQECFDLIFLPGLSSKTEVSDVSGRGVGMDVVKTRINQLNGSISINSAKDQGTEISIKVPLTLAIVPTLMVVVGDRTFAIPLLSILEIFEYEPAKRRQVDGQQIVLIRDKAIPIYFLRSWLINGHGHQLPERGHVVLVGVGAQTIGFVVDDLLGQEEVVIKPLGRMLRGTPGLAGATITGNGQIALILDVPGLVGHYASRLYSEVA